jgi:hypothetical protein
MGAAQIGPAGRQGGVGPLGALAAVGVGLIAGPGPPAASTYRRGFPLG